jgi:hypothetical protein
MTPASTQVGSVDWSGSFTYANYQAGFVTLRSRAYNGLTFDANYTYSHALDNFGITQECTGAIPDAFDHHRSYGPSLFDRRHTFNLLVNYELPFGKGKKLATGAFADRASMLLPAACRIWSTTLLHAFRSSAVRRQTETRWD